MTEELKNCLCGHLRADESKGWNHCSECDMWVGAVVAHCYCGAAEPPREMSSAFVADILKSLQNNNRADMKSEKSDIEWLVCDKCGACSHLACYPEIAALDAISFAEKSFFCKECGQKDKKSGPAVAVAEKPVGEKPVDDDDEAGQDETKLLAMSPTTRRFSPAYSTFSMLKPPLKPDTPSTSSPPLISKKASQKASKKIRPEPDGVSTFVQCPDCPMISGSRGAIRTHCVSFHNHSKSDVVRASYNFQLVPKPDRWRCVRCPNLFFKNNSALCAHWASAHNNNKSDDKPTDNNTDNNTTKNPIKNPLSNNNAIGTDVSSKVAQAAQLANIAKTYITTNTLATASHTTTTTTTTGLTAGYAFYRRAPPPPRTLSTTVSTPFRSSATTASTTTILPPYRVSNAPKRLFAPYSPPTVVEEPVAFQEQSQAKKHRKSSNIGDDLTPPRFIDSTADNGADDHFYKDEYDTLDSYLKESIDKDDIAVDVVDRQSDSCATSNSNVLSNALSSTNTASTNAAFNNDATVSNAVSNALSENVASLSTVQSVASSAVPVQMSLDMASTFMSTFMSALTRQKLALVEKEMEKEMQKQMTQKKNDEAPSPPPSTTAPIDYLPPHEEIAQQQQQPEQSPAEKKEQVVFQQAVDEQLEEEEEQPIICDDDNKCNEPEKAVDKDDDMCGKGTEQCRVAFARNFPFKSAAQIDKWCSLLSEHEIETIYDLRTLDSTTFDSLCSKIGASLLFQDLLVKLRK